MIRCQGIIPYALLLTVCLLISPAKAQDASLRLKCKGEMPRDFKERFSDTYEATLEKDKQIKKRSRRSQKDFAALSSLAIDHMLRSGKVLYGDEISVYASGILDHLLKDDQELRKSIRVYTLRSNSVNAFSTHQGIILITTGLVARLENEAQLAFILSHEVAHYVKKHSMQAFDFKKQLEKKEGLRGQDKVDERILKSAQYSREAEFEADEWGWDLYLKANYPLNEIRTAFDLLLYAYLPIECLTFDTVYAGESNYHLPKKSVDYELNAIQGEEDIDDSKSTHPNIFRRKKALKNKATQNESKTYQKNFVDEGQFLIMRNLARRESIYQYLIGHAYTRALILCDAWQGADGLSSGTINYSRALALYNLQVLRNERSNVYRGFPKDEREALQGPQLSYYHAIRQMTRDEFNVFVLRELWKCHQKDPNDERVRNLLELAVAQAQSHMDITIPFLFDRSLSSLGVNALEQMENCNGCKGVFDAAEYRELKKLLESDQTVEKKKPVSESDEYTIRVSRILMLSPRYFAFDLRKSLDKRYLRGDSRQAYMESVTQDIGKELGLEIIVPDSRSLSEDLTSDFNHYASLMDWMGDRMSLQYEGMQTVTSETIEEIRKKHGTDQLAVIYYSNFIERKEMRWGAAAGSLVFPYLFPVYLYWQLTPRTETEYVFFMLDLKTGTISYVDLKEFNAQFRPYLFKAHMYNTLNQIRK